MVIQYLTDVIQTRPLTIRFSFYNPHGSDRVAYVPRLLSPLGAFIHIEVTKEEAQVVYHSQNLKINLKLDPSRAESYLALEPGYIYGTLLAIGDIQLAPGEYRLRLTYSNLPFTGTEEHPLGEIKYETTISFRIT